VGCYTVFELESAEKRHAKPELYERGSADTHVFVEEEAVPRLSLQRRCARSARIHMLGGEAAINFGTLCYNDKKN
jgi:hypothetical protein